jgi:hypothetical protein
MNDLYLLLAVAVALGAIVVGVLLFTMRRLRQRRAQLLNELGAGAPFGEDRAFNRLEMARREVAILARQGTDVHQAREQIGLAETAFRARQYPQAYELAQSAHESLVRARRGPVTAAPETTAPAASPRATPSPVAGTPLPAAGTSPAGRDGAGPTVVSRPAPNRVESQFQLRLLDGELAEARASHPNAPATVAAVEFRSQAQVAFDSGNFTDALRIALKARRGLGGKVESLPLSPGAPVAGTGNGSDSPNVDGADPTASAERAAGSSRCPQCGYPVATDDVYCRGCGTPRVPIACPRCGAARSASDTFCGRCGERFS